MSKVSKVCPHGYRVVASCVDCMMDEGVGRPSTPKDGWVAASRAFGAKYDSQCPACNLGIHYGEMVVFVDAPDDSGSFVVHLHCATPRGTN